MYRLAVIDDEYIVVRGIEAIIKREKLDCEIVGAAYNGIEALAMLREKKPDEFFGRLANGNVRIN